MRLRASQTDLIPARDRRARPHRHPSHRPTAARRWRGRRPARSISDASHPPGDAITMYRGSRLAASFLLVLTGSAVLSVGLFILPSAVGRGAAWWIVPLGVAAGILHFAALVGISRGRDWGRTLAVLIAEFGGGIAILGAVALLTGAHPFGASSATGVGLLAWSLGVYALLGIAAGRIPVLARLTPIERRRVVFGPSFAGVAR
jgi:hypothetical protein